MLKDKFTYNFIIQDIIEIILVELQLFQESINLPDVALHIFNRPVIFSFHNIFILVDEFLQQVQLSQNVLSIEEKKIYSIYYLWRYFWNLQLWCTRNRIYLSFQISFGDFHLPIHSPVKSLPLHIQILNPVFHFFLLVWILWVSPVVEQLIHFRSPTLDLLQSVRNFLVQNIKISFIVFEVVTYL